MKKGTQIMICISACFVCLLAGLFIGRNTTTQLPQIDSNLSQPQSTSPTSAENVFIDGKININTASVDELVLLPNIGKTLAQRIVDYRQINGYFQSIDDLTKVSGIGQTKIDQLSNYITVGD